MFAGLPRLRQQHQQHHHCRHHNRPARAMADEVTFCRIEGHRHYFWTYLPIFVCHWCQRCLLCGNGSFTLTTNATKHVRHHFEAIKKLYPRFRIDRAVVYKPKGDKKLPPLIFGSHDPPGVGKLMEYLFPDLRNDLLHLTDAITYILNIRLPVCNGGGVSCRTRT